MIFDTKQLEWRPLYNEVQNLVHSANGTMVESVIADGKMVVKERKITTVDEEETLSGLRRRETDLKARLRVPIMSPWKFI